MSRIGCIADDLTGATDLANNFARAGLRVALFTDVPRSPMTDACDAIVVALKSRTLPVERAVELSLRAANWLRSSGATYLYFKVCSTFDSTPSGNIGPVADALRATTEAGITSIVIAFPENDRTVYKGHLFVGDALLSDTGMRHHPLTPMTQSNLVSLMGAQCNAIVGQIDLQTVRAGEAAIVTGVEANQRQGAGYVVLDAVEDCDLEAIGSVVSSHRMVVASSGLAAHLARGLGLADHAKSYALPGVRGASAIVSGSCSRTTRRQIECFIAQGHLAFPINDALIRDPSSTIELILEKASATLSPKPLLVYSDPAQTAQAALHERFGSLQSGEIVERALASIAVGLVARGVGRLLVAGGETSGACIEALGIRRLDVGSQIEPGVPWCHGWSESQGTGIHIALKSGNFGADEMFTNAFEVTT